MFTRRLVLALLLACVIPAIAGIARAADTRTVTVSASVTGLGRTPEQARREALQRARDRAVEEVAGVRIAAQQMRLKTESGGAVQDAFSYLVHTSTHGRIVSEDVVHRTSLDGDVPVYQVVLQAEVVLEEGVRDPGFDLELALHPRSATLRDGEAVVIEITATRDCYVTVLNVHADGTVSRVFPNAHAPDGGVTAGSALRLGGAGSGFEVRAELAPGSRRDHEQIVAIATLDDVPFRMERVDDDEMVPAVERDLDLTAVNRWLLGIPVDRRIEALWSYEVVE